LNAYKNLQDMGGKQIVHKAWESLNECMNFKVQFSGSLAEQKYME